ncbi:MAG: hypothetical protein LBH19_02425, partial [Dysgonamonadaceae bacterium]|nr:hypothetical protein [Dysgonamonadaceae bacterium]
MTQKTEIKLFEDQRIRTSWDEELEEWYFSVVDVIEILINSANLRDYGFKMKQRVKLEDGIELSTICRQLKLVAADGKKYLTDCADVQSLFRIIQSIPSPTSKILCFARGAMRRGENTGFYWGGIYFSGYLNEDQIEK